MAREGGGAVSEGGGSFCMPAILERASGSLGAAGLPAKFLAGFVCELIHYKTENDAKTRDGSPEDAPQMLVIRSSLR